MDETIRCYLDIEQYLLEEKNCRAVNAQELADTLYEKLDKVSIGDLSPIQLAHSLIGTKTFDDALAICVHKYQKSVVVKDKIESYLSSTGQDRANDSYVIDNLISMLPMDRRNTDDRQYQAYTAICWLEDRERETAESITAEDILYNIDMEREFVSDVASNVKGSEPYEVAYRNAFEKALGTAAKQYGKVKSMPARLSDVAMQSVHLGERETLGENLQSKVHADKELEALLRYKEEERLKLIERIESLEKVKEKQTYQQPLNYSAQGTRYGYNNYNQPQGDNIKLFGIAFNIAILVICQFIDRIAGTSTVILIPGLAASCYGWATLPKSRDLGNGVYRSQHPGQYVDTGNHRTQLKSVWWILGGYAWVILFIFIMVVA